MALAVSIPSSARNQMLASALSPPPPASIETSTMHAERLSSHGQASTSRSIPLLTYPTSNIDLQSHQPENLAFSTQSRPSPAAEIIRIFHRARPNEVLIPIMYNVTQPSTVTSSHSSPSNILLPSQLRLVAAGASMACARARPSFRVVVRTHSGVLSDDEEEDVLAQGRDEEMEQEPGNMDSGGGGPKLGHAAPAA